MFSTMHMQHMTYICPSLQHYQTATYHTQSQSPAAYTGKQWRKQLIPHVLMHTHTYGATLVRRSRNEKLVTHTFLRVELHLQYVFLLWTCSGKYLAPCICNTWHISTHHFNTTKQLLLTLSNSSLVRWPFCCASAMENMSLTTSSNRSEVVILPVTLHREKQFYPIMPACAACAHREGVACS